MNIRIFRLFAPVAMLGLFACAAPFAPAPAKSTLIVRQVGNGPATATIRIAPAGYGVQAVAHSWIPADVFEYRIALKVQDGGTFVDLTPPQAVVLPAAATTASFTGLNKGVYQAEVVAWGNVGGSAASQALMAAPAVVPLDLSSSNAVSGNATLTLDAVVLDASALARITPPTDGTFAAPSASPTIEP